MKNNNDGEGVIKKEKNIRGLAIWRRLRSRCSGEGGGGVSESWNINAFFFILDYFIFRIGMMLWRNFMQFPGEMTRHSKVSYK